MTGAPACRCYSLYGSTFESLSPRPEWLEGLDALVFDIQDVGSRYYTYVYTMALAMKAAAQGEGARSTCSTGPTRSAASASRGTWWASATAPSWACTRCPTATA